MKTPTSKYTGSSSSSNSGSSSRSSGEVKGAWEEGGKQHFRRYFAFEGEDRCDVIEENLGKEKGKVPRIRDANQPASNCIVV